MITFEHGRVNNIFGIQLSWGKRDEFEKGWVALSVPFYYIQISTEIEAE